MVVDDSCQQRILRLASDLKIGPRDLLAGWHGHVACPARHHASLWGRTHGAVVLAAPLQSRD